MSDSITNPQVGSRTLHSIVRLFIPDLREVWFRWRVSGQPFGSKYRQDIHITPAIVWTPFQRSTLASVESLGIETKAGWIGVEFWTWHIVLSYGISRQSNPAIRTHATEGSV